MPDYGINDPYNCQVLITVPAMLEIILSKKTDLNNKIKYVILDEIQTLNDSELGHSLEKIIHFVQCPMIILSATIGNIGRFYEWLKSIHEDKGVDIYPKPILNEERFCDLKKFAFVPTKTNEAAKENAEEQLVPVHELFGYSYVDLRENRLSEEFFLLPNELIELLNTLEKIATTERQKLLVNNIQPEKFFKSVILNKNHVKRYQDFLMDKLVGWCKNDEFEEAQINDLFALINEKTENGFRQLEESYNRSQKKWALQNITQLVKSLHQNKMLPAIVFLNTYDFCNELAEKLVNDLENEEEENKKDNKKANKQPTKLHRETKKKADKNADWREQSELLEELQESYIDVNKIDEKYTYLDRKFKLSDKEIDEEIDSHKFRPNIPTSMFEAWKRGIGVHHANFHNKFRSSVEYLFRKRHLQIVFATETLSLGINMPCKTVVLTCDSIGFSSIKYKQMVGRAGRRTFDTIGNIVYYGLPRNKIKNFISSKIPNIKGNFSFNLNLITQLSVMNTYDSSSVKKFKSFVKNPIIRLNDDEYDYMTCKKIASLQLNYLINKSMIDTKFNPSNQVFFSIPIRNEDVTQNIIEELIKQNYFDRFVNECENNHEEIATKIVNVFSHFIAVKYLLPTTIETNIALPEIPSLTKFLNTMQNNQSAYIRNFLNDKVELAKAAFPYFNNELNYPKNSYVLDFYLNGKKDDIKEFNKVNETSLWYSLKSFRTVLRTINRSVTFPDKFVKKAFEHCEDTMTDRFKLIIN
jgi:superfamily II RNA helicase